MRQAGCALLLLLLFPVAAVAQAPRDNLLLIVADDLGVDAVGCYGLGGAPPPTPVIDYLAGRGVRFTNAFACPNCSPTRAALLTGRHGFRTGIRRTVWITEPGLPVGEITLPRILAANQIPSALIGVWHLGTHSGLLTPNVMGWQHFAGILDYGVTDYYQWAEVRDGQQSTVTTYATTHQVDEALTWINAQTQPWMLMLCFAAPHGPFHAPPSQLHTQNLSGLSAAATPLPFYKAMVQAMDTEIGRLLLGLGPQLARTNVVFTSDNGTPQEGCEPPFPPNRAKGTLYRAGSQVPLIVAGPAVAAPAVCASPISVVDLLPTALALLAVPAASGVPPGTTIDGVDFAPIVRGPCAAVRTTTYSEVLATSFGEGSAIRSATHELLHFTGSGTAPHAELYDVLNDPHEQLDLLVAPVTPAVQAIHDQLKAALWALRPDSFVEPFGRGCSSVASAPVLAPVNTPRVGASFVLDVLGVPNGMLRVGAIGFSRTRSASGALLPFDLGVLGAPGCDFSIRLDISHLCQTATAPWSIAIPPNNAWNGTPIYLQLFAFDPVANAFGLVSSRGWECTVGF